MLRALAGGELFGEVWGPEPARVVALHGWRRTHTDFAGVLGPDSPGGALGTLAVDLPGFGATPAPAEGWGSGDYAEVVVRLLEGPEGPGVPAVLVGHSFGGRVAVEVAARRPDLVGGLVLTGVPLVLAGPGSGRKPAAGYRVVRTLRRFGLVGEDRLERARQRHGSEDYRQAQGVMREVLVRVLAERYDEALAATTCPVELVWGDDDTAAPLRLAEAARNRLAEATLTVCPGAGHLTPLTEAPALREAVARALGRSPASGVAP